MKVYVYYNLHKSCWSVKDYKTGLVIFHTQEIRLKNVEFRVRKGGQARVREQGKKNVHAFVIGEIDTLHYNEEIGTVNKIYYNPYLTDNFIIKSSKQEIFNAEFAILTTSRQVFASSF